jgi:hypothetical protein
MPSAASKMKRPSLITLGGQPRYGHIYGHDGYRAANRHRLTQGAPAATYWLQRLSAAQVCTCWQQHKMKRKAMAVTARTQE